MASILHRGSNQYRVQIRRKGTSVCRTFETRREAEDWGRVMEGKISGGETATISTAGLAPGDYTVTGHISEGPKPTQHAECNTSFRVRASWFSGKLSFATSSCSNS